MTPQKSLMMTIILFNSSRMYEGDILNLVVATTYIDDFFR